ncbi:hypothetical protein E3N88_15631 [Mikania micrantha]|uniref:Uncharacterized protein n=1 Tax=Mikania micrantha TaxID=192012 RepID=A0A5N6NXS4_9ASTR|nr:hypothetical protein E3N88_15631 [Mikania micrantha]
MVNTRSEGSGMILDPVVAQLTTIASSFESLKADVAALKSQSYNAKGKGPGTNRFEDGDPRGWVLKAEKYFRYYQIPEEEQVDVASMHLEGDAPDLFSWLSTDQLIQFWEELVHAFQRNFRPAEFQNPDEHFCSIRQTGIFLNGLKEELKADVHVAISTDPGIWCKVGTFKLLEADNEGDEPVEVHKDEPANPDDDWVFASKILYPLFVKFEFYQPRISTESVPTFPDPYFSSYPNNLPTHPTPPVPLRTYQHRHKQSFPFKQPTLIPSDTTTSDSAPTASPAPPDQPAPHPTDHPVNISATQPPDTTYADYFSKNNEFATWLKDERDIFFSDLSSDSARKLFTKFVKDWNNKKLDSKYYDGIETGPRSSHNWKIKSDTKDSNNWYHIAVLCSVTPAAAHSPTLLLLNLMLLLWSSPLPPLLPPQLLPLPLPTITAAPPYATVTGTAVAPTV